MGYFPSFVMCTFLITFQGIYSVPVSESNGTPWTNLDGPMLINLGRKVNKPILTLLGMTIKEFHPCSEWTRWSPCIASKRGSFGTKSRQRSCKNSLTATTENKRATEKDLGLCEGFCPKDYNITENGFCLKLYEVKMNQGDAMKQCEQDGGHLTNIDTDLKHGDVKKFLTGVKEKIFVDGHRKTVNSPWVFTYGSQKRHIEWASGQPDDASISLCLALDEQNTRLMHDIDCGAEFYFFCEIYDM